MYIKPAIESEATLLGALLLDSHLYVNVKDKLCPSDFSSERHQQLFDGMKTLFSKHGSFDVPMLIDHIDYENSEDTAHLFDLANNCCSTANINAHADIIREKSVQRQLMQCAREVISKELLKPNEDDMANDFVRFTYVIQPSFADDVINLILVCVHNESNLNTNALIDPLELINGGHGYLFGLMNELTTILKSKKEING